MRLLNVPPPPRHRAPLLLPAIAALALAFAVLVLSTVGLGEWFAPLVLACVVCLLPLVPSLLHLRRP
jgi:hypothetical protein